jgi:RNA polymerase sigma-70 factor (ECF subfamily)
MLRRGVVKGVGGATLAEIEALYRASIHRYRGVAAAIVRDRETACDIVQEAFAAAVRRRRSFRGDGPLEAWLWRAVVNASLSHARQSRPVPPREAAAQAEPARADVRDAVAALPERQRLAVFLRYYADLDYRAIGEVLGVTDGTARASVHAAHATLRRTLEVAL